MDNSVPQVAAKQKKKDTVKNTKYEKLKDLRQRQNSKENLDLIEAGDSPLKIVKVKKPTVKKTTTKKTAQKRDRTNANENSDEYDIIDSEEELNDSPIKRRTKNANIGKGKKRTAGEIESDDEYVPSESFVTPIRQVKKRSRKVTLEEDISSQFSAMSVTNKVKEQEQVNQSSSSASSTPVATNAKQSTRIRNLPSHFIEYAMSSSSPSTSSAANTNQAAQSSSRASLAGS